MKHTTVARLLLILLLGTAAPAWAIFKCETGGKVAYTDTPCEGGKAIDVAIPVTTDADAAGKQAAQEKRQLNVLERERHKREAAEGRELKKASGESATRHKKCAAHARRQKLANEDVARSTGLANEKARRKAQRVTEDYEAACGRWYERELGVAR